MRRWLVFVLLAMMYILPSCSTPTSLAEYHDLSEEIEYSVAVFPAVKFDDILWRTDGVLVAMQDESVRPLRQPYSLEGDSNLSYLDLPHDNDCVHTKYRFPTQLPDGRLGLIKWCVTDNVFTDTSYMVAYDWETSQLEQIVQNPLKHFDIAQCFSWNPDMTRGIQSVSNGLVGTLNWLTRVGPEPVNITLRDGNRVWNLAKDFEENGRREGGRISCPSWSPNGDKIAVFVSFDAMGVEWVPRLDKQSQLIFIFPEAGDTESILSGVYYPKSTQWSPDGKRIAFTGYLENGQIDYQGNEQYGLWVFDVETKSLWLIAKEKYYEDFSWSPDSKRLAVIWCNRLDCEESEENEIREYRLPN
jgi:WD40 repeat protein